MTFPRLFAKKAKGYKAHYKFSNEQLKTMFAKISSKNHKNALLNPLAQLPLNIEPYDILNMPENKNLIIADSLGLYDCSLITNDAAAIVLSKLKYAKVIKNKLIEIISMETACNYLPMFKRLEYEFTAGKIDVRKAYKKAKININDLDFAEVYECFTIAEILAYEVLAIKKDGEGYKVLEKCIVYKDGKLPVNLSGGLKAKGHQVGTTGVSMALTLARQLLKKTLGFQLNNSQIDLTFNFGNSAASNYASIFRRSSQCTSMT